MAVHVDEAEEVEAHGRREAAQEHPGEDEAVLVRLVVRRQVVQVEHADLEHGRVRAHAHVRDRADRQELPERESD